MISVNLRDDQSEMVHYNFEDYPIYIQKSLLSSYYNFEAPVHWHSDLELLAVLKGDMNYYINGEIITIGQGDGVFINSKQLHRGFSKTKDECEFICVLVHPLLLCVTQAMEQKYVLPLLKDENIPYVKLSADVQWKKEVLGLILDMYHERESETAPLTLAASFLKIWSLIYEKSDISISVEKKNGDFTILKNMIGYIQKNYYRKITLDDIAKSGAVGQSKCCKLFAKYIGTTPNTYLIRYRLHQSFWYLKNTDMTIIEVAQTVGFSGSSYYAEIFRKWYNKSPSEYRKT